MRVVIPHSEGGGVHLGVGKDSRGGRDLGAQSVRALPLQQRSQLEVFPLSQGPCLQ